MAKYTPNTIYTYLKLQINWACPDVYVTGVDEPISNQQKAVKIHEVGRYRPRGSVDLSNEDEQYRIAYQADVYSNLFNGHTDEAYETMHVVEEAFRKLFFIETSCTPVERVDNRVARLVARFERQVCEGDEMPE